MHLPTLRDAVGSQMAYLFGAAGVCDKVLTRSRIALAKSHQKEVLLDRFHARWEAAFLKDLDDGSREIEHTTGAEGVVAKRRASFAAKLEHLRGHKASLLNFG